jgi:zinc finger protein
MLIDPLGHSFLQNPKYPDPDPHVIVEHFERTEDQNEFLGLSDINVDHYQK